MTLLRAAMPVALVAFGFTAPSKAQTPALPYDKTWNIAKAWSGEYPTGFSVTRRGTVVLARSAMNKALPRSVKCELPYLAVIHPWNGSRTKKNKIEFLSAAKIVPLTAKEDFAFEPDVGSKIAIKKGDVVEYLRYFGEGAFQVRIAGKAYDAQQDLFDHMEEVSKDRFVEEEWAALNCQAGTRAFIFLRDLNISGEGASREPGISDVGPGVQGFGKARDLTEKEARAMDRAPR